MIWVLGPSAAANDEIAYEGAGAPESVARQDDWRRFLDLLEEIGGSEQAGTLFGKYVTSADMTARTDARAAYAELNSSGWDAPLYVRSAMGEWNFASAEERIEEAQAILEKRDSILLNATELGVEMPTSLEEAYEGSVDGMDEAAILAGAQLDTSENVLSARAAVLEPRDLLTNIGLVGENTDRELAEAVEAFAEGKLDLATSEANEAVLLIGSADEVGQTRVLIAIGTFLSIVMMTVAFVTVLNRRRRSSSETHLD